MTFRILDQAPQYLLRDGSVNAYGFLWTFQNGTAIPKTTWSDPGMTTENPNPIPLDSAGRTEFDVWGDGDYTLRLEDFLTAEIWTRDDVQSGETAASVFPPGTAGQFLTTDGTNVSFVSILQVPDPTGQSGKFLTNDGVNSFWQAIPAPPAPDIEVLANSFRAGKYLVQRGTGTAPATGAPTTSSAIVYPVSYATIWQVVVTLNSHSQPGGPVVWELSAAPSVTGVTVLFDVAEGNAGNPNVVNPIPYSWTAYGLIP